MTELTLGDLGLENTDAVVPTVRTLFENAMFRVEVRKPAPDGWQGDPNGYYVVVNRDTGIDEYISAQYGPTLKFAHEWEELIGRVRVASGGIKVQSKLQ